MCYSNKNGYVALLSVIVVGAIAVTVAVTLLLAGIGWSQTSFDLERSNQAKALVNACAEEALQQIRNSTPFTGYGSLSLGQGTCGYVVTSGGGQNRTVNASSTVGVINRKVQITITAITPLIIVSAWQEVI